MVSQVLEFPEDDRGAERCLRGVGQAWRSLREHQEHSEGTKQWSNRNIIAQLFMDYTKTSNTMHVLSCVNLKS